jgi:hypothetical protein
VVRACHATRTLASEGRASPVGAPRAIHGCWRWLETGFGHASRSAAPSPLAAD